MKQIILATQSPRKIDIFKKTGLHFKAIPSNYEEKFYQGMAPKKLSEYLSQQKAQEVANRHKNRAVIIATDTLVIWKGEIFGKLRDEKNAFNILRTLSGNTHQVITGFTILDTLTNQSLTRSVKTKVQFRKLTKEEIISYIATGEPFGKAGGYAIQERGSMFVERIQGDFYNILGMPLYAIAKHLKKFGVYPL